MKELEKNVWNPRWKKNTKSNYSIITDLGKVSNFVLALLILFQRYLFIFNEKKKREKLTKKFTEISL